MRLEWNRERLDLRGSLKVLSFPGTEVPMDQRGLLASREEALLIGDSAREVMGPLCASRQEEERTTCGTASPCAPLPLAQSRLLSPPSSA